MNASARILLAAGVVIHVVFLLSLILPGHFLNPLFVEGMHNLGEGQGSDFYAFYQAGRYVLEGKDIYTDPMNDPDRIVPYAYFYRYLPFVAYTLGVATNGVPPRVAYWIWVLVVELVLLLCIRATGRMVTDRSLFGYLASMWLMFSPFYIEQYMGQLTFVMAALIFLMTLSYARGRLRSFDWWWILSVVVKHLTIIFVPILIRMKRYKTILISLALLAVTTIPYLILVDTGVGKFRHDNFNLNLYPYPGNLGALALLMVLKARFFPAASQIATYIGPLKLSITRALVFIAMAVPTLTSLWVTFRRKPFDMVESVGMWTMTYFFVFREVWEYHYVLLIPVFVLFYAKSRARILWTMYALLAIPTLFILYDVPGAYPENQWTAFPHVMNHAFKIAWLAWLFVWTARGGLRKHTKRQESLVDTGLAVPL